MDRTNAIVIARVFERVDDILQYGLRLCFVEQFGERAVERIALEFLDDRPHRLDKQRRSLRQKRRRSGQSTDENGEQEEQQQQVQ